MTFGKKVYLLRKQKGYSQDELADKLGVTRQSVSKWELDEMLPDCEKTVKMAKLFSVTTDYLLKENIDAKPKRTIPALPDKYDNVDFIAALSAFVVSVAAFGLYRFRLFWAHYAHDETLKHLRNDHWFIYKDWIWVETLDEIVILSFLAVIIAVSFIITIRIYRKHKQVEK